MPSFWCRYFRNRAIHDDLVAIKLFPKSQWRSHNNALPTEEGQKSEEAEGVVEGTSKVMPTGMVIGILQRADRLYVASFDVSFDRTLGHTKLFLLPSILTSFLSVFSVERVPFFCQI